MKGDRKIKFLRKYPNPKKRYVNLEVSSNEHKCRMCGAKTLFKDAVSDYYFYSEECQAKYYRFAGVDDLPPERDISPKR